MDFKLKKQEKLTSRTAVERLFGEGHSLMAFPLRAVYRLREAGESPVQFMITIPKKRIRKAVMRVTLRRRVRESYRLRRRALLHESLQHTDVGVDIAFIYLDNQPVPYHILDEKMTQLLTRIAQAAAERQEHHTDYPNEPAN